MRMAYLRKPDDMKRGNPLKDKRKVVANDQPRMPTAPATPLYMCGEDDASIARHCKMLTSEMKRVNPNRQVIKQLMAKTFTLRRRQILEGMGTVQDIIKVYPALKYPEEVSIPFLLG